MKNDAVGMPARLAATVLGVAITAAGLAGCAGDSSNVDRARAQVTAKEKAVTEAEADLAAASGQFCGASEDYILALDRYGDVLTDSAPTVGDVRVAGADLAKPREAAFEDAEVAVEAQESLAAAEQELAEARAALAQAEAGPTGTPTDTGTAPPTRAPLAPAATVDRVTQAESEFTAAQGAITDQTPLASASEQFNSAAVALEMAWLRLFVDAGCIPDEQQQSAQAAVSAYTAALQQDLTDAGYYAEGVDGVYGPATTAAVEDLQEANGLPVTGTVDKATSEALQAELLALGGAAAKESVATTAAVQQTLKLAGFWDGPVDGIWTPELTEALMALQTALGVEPTGNVDAITVAAFQKAIAELSEPEASPTPTPAPTPSPEPSEEP
ncbi:peptidoglycan-binding domain-containing protein [Mycetocola sp. 2940]|uniref:peptidoglycan-binding domain-containing protein n=1 Tax=Mycetocola sp. 2940 TaxID=3156452 RepID=UPI0033939F14